MGSGTFGVGSVSAASVPTGVGGGGAGSLSQTVSQGYRREGCWHTLVVMSPENEGAALEL